MPKKTLTALLVTAAVGASPAPPTDTEKLAALTRLYGVVRWFHPGDSAQEIDWNRFAIHACRRVRAARRPGPLKWPREGRSSLDGAGPSGSGAGAT